MNYSKMYDQNEFDTQETEIEAIKIIPATETGDKIGVVNYKEVYIREDPSLTKDPLGTVKEGEELFILSEQDGWYKVITPTDLEGYIMSNFVTVE